jgi:hypothetical protein
MREGKSRRALLLSCALALALPAIVAPAAPAAAAPVTWTITGPGTAPPTSAQVVLNNGLLTLAVLNRGATVLLPSAIGIQTTTADLTRNLTFVARADRVVTEAYTMTTGKQRNRSTTFNETTLSFTGAANVRLDVVIRVSGEGVTYRYGLPAAGTVRVTREASSWTLPTSAPAWLVPNQSEDQGVWFETTAGAAPSNTYAQPSLFDVGGTFVLLADSNLDGRYAGSQLAHTAGSGTYTTTLASPQIVSTGPLATPWRVAIVGDLKTVTESRLVDDVARPSRVSDPSWIHPGTSAWSWLTEHSSPSDPARQRQYIDFAQRNGWEYVLIDEGWASSWAPGVVQYARDRGVQVILWFNSNALQTAEQREAWLPLVKSWGVAGVKIDFIFQNTQPVLQWYDAILARTAELRLMVNFHGAVTPRGMQRTWPHVMTAEAVFGAEQQRNRAALNTILPFTRNVISSMDFTPVTFSITNRDTTDGHELATALVFESGWQHDADRPESYEARPLALGMLNQLPTAWDETRLLGGRPGREAYFARRAGDRWYVGGISALAAKTFQAPLSFLGQGQWLVETVRDGAGGALLRETRVVGSADTLSVPVATRGGFVSAICRFTSGMTGCGSEPAPPTGSAFVSDLTVQSTNGWGPVERDRSNGETGPADGRTLTIAGASFAKGFGTHAASDITVWLGAGCSQFQASVGVDDEVTGAGTVVFQVLGDGRALLDTGVVRRGEAARPVTVNVTAIQTLTLRVTDAGDGVNFDHADWANARLAC